MCQTEFDMTYTDLNPRFLFSCIHDRINVPSNHCHDFIELVIILKGSRVFVINDAEYPVKEGDVVLLNPGTYYWSQPSEDALECYLGFTDVEFKNCMKNHLPLFQGGKLIQHLPEQIRGTIFRLCRAMEEESEQHRAGCYFMLKAHLIQILCLLERFREENTAKTAERQGQYQFTSLNKKYIVKKIMEYMELHYQEKISLDQIAANMYLSSYYISKIFKSETGDTPINYLISMRMKKARELLDERPELPIQVVASQVGYEDAYHFSKLFKKYFGLSPLYYKGRL